ncbi:MAG: hypothetical protein ACC635_05090 [Acidiferrobacterales bacterium]
MKKLKIFLIILGLVATPFAACKADAATGLFTVQMKLALKGKSHDQYFLGVMYEEGLGSDVDLKSARMWYEKSARQNYALAIKKLKQLDKPKPVLKRNPYATTESNPKKTKIVRARTKAKPGISKEELAARKEHERKRKAWQKAMDKQAEYAEDAFE